MTLENIYRIIASGIDGKLTEINIIIRIQKFTNVSWKRSVNGYRLMREEGLINNIVERSTVGNLERLESLKGINILIEKLNCIPTSVNLGKLVALQAKAKADYKENEIIPLVGFTRLESQRQALELISS